MMPTQPYKDPKGLTRALQGLAIAEILFCILNLVIGLSSGWPLPVEEGRATLFIGLIALVFILQFMVRTTSLVIRARWTYRLVANARRFQSLPISERWAWLSFFIPIASLWLPFRIHQALLAGPTSQRGLMRIVLIIWWLLRLATCLSGTLIFFVVLVLMFYRNAPTFSLTLILTLAIVGLPCAILSFIVVRAIAERQTAPNDIHLATVF